MIYVWSDTHFNHANILKYEPNRGFNSITKMDESIKTTWNEYINEDDIIYFLGDFSLNKPGKVKKLLSKLNGYKILIKGNHDRYSELTALNIGWNEYSSRYRIIQYKGIKLLLTHIPMYGDYRHPNFKKTDPDYRKYYRIFKENKCTYNLHGHIHSKTPEEVEYKFMDNNRCRMLCKNICYDMSNVPISLDKLLGG